jgi:cysteinyl-tRNA synthetase
MGKSLGNFITLNELFEGKHELLEKAYSPMTIRFFILQAHYRSPLDFSNEALQAAEKGMERMMKAVEVLESLQASSESTVDVKALKEKCYEAMNDDLNSPILIAHLFDGVKMINSINDGKEKVSASDLAELKTLYHDFVFDILGLQAEEQAAAGGDETMTHVVDLLLNLRMEAKKNKDWGTADKIRNELSALGFEIKDTKDGFSWELKK